MAAPSGAAAGDVVYMAFDMGNSSSAFVAKYRRGGSSEVLEYHDPNMKDISSGIILQYNKVDGSDSADEASLSILSRNTDPNELKGLRDQKKGEAYLHVDGVKHMAMYSVLDEMPGDVRTVIENPRVGLKVVQYSEQELGISWQGCTVRAYDLVQCSVSSGIDYITDQLSTHCNVDIQDQATVCNIAMTVPVNASQNMLTMYTSAVCKRLPGALLSFTKEPVAALAHALTNVGLPASRLASKYVLLIDVGHGTTDSVLVEVKDNDVYKVLGARGTDRFAGRIQTDALGTAFRMQHWESIMNTSANSREEVQRREKLEEAFKNASTSDTLMWEDTDSMDKLKRDVLSALKRAVPLEGEHKLDITAVRTNYLNTFKRTVWSEFKNINGFSVAAFYPNTVKFSSAMMDSAMDVPNERLRAYLRDLNQGLVQRHMQGDDDTLTVIVVGGGGLGWKVHATIAAEFKDTFKDRVSIHASQDLMSVARGALYLLLNKNRPREIQANQEIQENQENRENQEELENQENQENQGPFIEADISTLDYGFVYTDKVKKRRGVCVHKIISRDSQLPISKDVPFEMWISLNCLEDMRCPVTVIEGTLIYNDCKKNTLPPTSYTTYKVYLECPEFRQLARGDTMSLTVTLHLDTNGVLKISSVVNGIHNFDHVVEVTGIKRKASDEDGAQSEGVGA